MRDGGAEIENAGVITTPAIAFLAHTHGFSAGVVISASHNPWQDNGIKVFGGDGYKLPDEVELGIEQEIAREIDRVLAAKSRTARDCEAKLPPVNESYRAEYVAASLLDAVPRHLTGQSLRGD